MINRNYFLTIILIFTLIGCKTKNQKQDIESYSYKNIAKKLLYFPNDSLADQEGVNSSFLCQVVFSAHSVWNVVSKSSCRKRFTKSKEVLYLTLCK